MTLALFFDSASQILHRVSLQNSIFRGRIVWFRAEGNLKWGVYRNLPFAVTGLCLVILFFLSGDTGGYGLGLMFVAIIISFVCCFPVVLLAKKKPMVGMLMMPKTMAYIWMIAMGLGLIGKV